MVHLAQECWDMVVRNLPSFSIRPAAQVFGFKLERKQENHLSVWNVIFQDQAWLDKAVEHGLNPTLIGTGLTVYYNYRRAASAIYICLCAGPSTDSMTAPFTYPEANFKLLLNCLRSHSYDPSTEEIKFKCGIILNVSEIRGLNGIIAKPMRVLSYRHRSLRSSYMLWEDNTHSLRYIGWEGVRCRGLRQAEKVSDVQEECSIRLDDANGRQLTVSLTDPNQHRKNVATYWERQAAGEIDWNPCYDPLKPSPAWIEKYGPPNRGYSTLRPEPVL